MRKLFLFMMVSLDGYFEGVNHDTSWHNVDAEFNEFAVKQLNEIDELVFGHRTYDLMASYWPTKGATTDDPIVAGLMNSKPKVVVSHTLTKADWENTKVVNKDVEAEITKLKETPGKDIAVFGSSNLCVSLLEMGLLDEVRVIVNPIAIGAGTALFEGIKIPVNLKLTNSKAFKSGNVLLIYSVPHNPSAQPA